MGQSWSARAPVRRALIPAKRSSNCDILNSNVGPGGKSSSKEVDDRVHNALLEELCADFGVTDSSYVDFLSFDIPTNRVESGQLPADLEELGQIVSFVRPKTEPVHSVSEGVHRTGSSSSHVGLLGPGVTTAKTSSGMQMKIPDDVASPTISSSCEESKPADGGGEGLSDFPPTVHSTTGCASVRPDTDPSRCTVDHSQQPASKTESVVEHNYKQVLTSSAEVPDEQGSSTVSLSNDQSDRDDSTTPSPKHAAKKARIISGGELLEDVKKSYAFVCGADMFAAPARPVMSHPRWHTPIGSQVQLVPHSQNARGYGTRASFRDGCENPFQDSMENPSDGLRPASDRSYGASSLLSGNFDSLTPVKGVRQRYCNEWQTSPASSLDRTYQTNVMHHTNMMGNGTVDFRPNGVQFMQGTGTTGTGSDIRGSVPYTDLVQYPTAAEFPGHIDQNHLNYQSVNCSPRSTVDQSGRSYGYPAGPYGGSYELVGKQPGPRQNEFYRNPLASPYRNLPSNASDISLHHRTVTANEAGSVYPTGQIYPAQHSRPANVNTGNYNEEVNRGVAASPARYRSRPGTPGFVANYSIPTGIDNYMPETNSGNLRYASHDSATPTGRTSLMLDSGMQPAPIGPGIQNTVNFQGVPTQNKFSYNLVNTGVDRYAERRGNFPGTTDRSTVNQLTPRCGFVPSEAEQMYSASTGQSPEHGCLSFVRHLIGSGSGPYRSHPLFPLLRDLVIADMNFEAPSFPYPLIAGLPRSFDRLISNYFSCTANNANTASVDPSADAIVMDALRYAHSALLGNCANYCQVTW